MKILPRLTCETCKLALVSQVDRFAETDEVFTLLCIKNKGGLIKCSKEAYQLLRFVESELRRLIDIQKPLKNAGLLEKRLYILVLSEAENRRFLSSLSSHKTETASLLTNHVTDLMKVLVKTYLDCRQSYMLSCLNWEVTKGNLRQRLSRTVLFTHQ